MSVNRLELGTINSPELVLVMDASDNLVLEDADGNTVIRFNQDQTTDFFADLVDGPNSTTIYDQSSEEVTADVNNSSTVTEDAVVGDQNLTEHLLLGYPIWRLSTTSGDGSVTLPDNSTPVHHIQLRVPGSAASIDESRVFDSTTAFDPSIPGRIQIDVSNLAVDNNTNSEIFVLLTNAPDSGVFDGSKDQLGARIKGDGDVRALTSDDGMVGQTADSSQDNSYINSLETIEISWDGSSVTVTTDDGSTEVTASDSSNYPNEDLNFKIAARDGDGSNARNSDFDVGRVVVA